jgi:hypothetical protein
MSTYTRLQSKPDTTIKLTGLLYHRERDVQVGDSRLTAAVHLFLFCRTSSSKHGKALRIPHVLSAGTKLTSA